MSALSYNTLHAPFGAFSSFTCGYAASWDDEPAPNAGGFSPSTRHPANQTIFAGWRQGKGPWQLLPFLKRRSDRSADFTSASAHGAHVPIPEIFEIVPEGSLTRELGLASDRWRTGPFELTLFTPFEKITDWENLDEGCRKLLCAPVVPAQCLADNSHGKEDIEILFGFGDTERGLRYVGDTATELTGFASANNYGFAAKHQPGLRAKSGMDLFWSWREDRRSLHLLGSEGALILKVPAGQKGRLDLALGFLQQSDVTTGIQAPFYYTRYFQSLDQILSFGIEHFDTYAALASARDAEFAKSGLSADRKWLLAQSVHNYLGATQLLLKDGKPLWVVNEGEYRMMNTFDLSVDHLFFELAWWPWTVRDTLDLFASRYSYVDTLHSTDGRHAPGGITFTHDMGVDNQFTPKGTSSYELPNLKDCFSYMSAEQLVNWICCAVTYTETTGDMVWLEKNRALLLQCAESLRHRDDPEPIKRNGIMKWDSDQCGPNGSEITTYDSLDISLGQARNNLYLAVKTLGAWLLLARAFSKLGLVDDAQNAQVTAHLAGSSIMTFREYATGLFPAVFEGGNTSRIIPAVEGLAFPLYLKLEHELKTLDQNTGIVSALGEHLGQVLRRGICLDGVTGGWKLSSTSDNTWLSKVYLCQFVGERLFKSHLTEEACSIADLAHKNWLLSRYSRHFSYCDQIRSTDGYPYGSKHYPRGVTAWLWTT